MRTLRELGERWILQYVARRLNGLPGALLPPGDDAADMPFDGRLIISSDMMLQSTDIPQGMRFRDVGYKAVTAATSDAAAKGAKPLAYLISLALPPETTEEEFKELWRGFEEAVKLYGGGLAGGDTNMGGEVIIDVSCIASGENPVSRAGARPGDLLAVTGMFGAQAAGLHALLKGKNAESVVKRFLRPVARVKEGVALAESNAVSASMDSSDGLSETLHSLAEASCVGFLVEKPPVDELAREYAEENGLNLFDLVFNGGEEYELVVTIKPLMLEEAVKAVEEVGGRLEIIGRATEDVETVKAVWEGRIVDVPRRGYQHFKSRSTSDK